MPSYYRKGRIEWNRLIAVLLLFVVSTSMGKAQENLYTTAELHEYVDLGLSVKWATCNVGANTPEEFGDYFAWGETAPKSEYTWSSYTYCTDDEGKMFSKYVLKKRQGDKDGKNTLDLSDDAAHVRISVRPVWDSEVGRDVIWNSSKGDFVFFTENNKPEEYIIHNPDFPTSSVSNSYYENKIGEARANKILINVNIPVVAVKMWNIISCS